MPKAMILAAGFGTRLRPLTLELPKPLVWVGDRPAIAHIASRLVAAGITDIAVNTHHRADAFSPDLLAQIPGTLRIVTEPEILGTGGGVANAAPLFGEDDVLVWNGDILAPLDVTALLAAHASTPLEGASRSSSVEHASRDTVVQGASHDTAVEHASRDTVVQGASRGAPAAVGATLAITRLPVGQGTVGVGADGRVVRLRGELFGEERSGGDFLGISVVTAALRRTLPIPGCLVGDGLLPWLRAGGSVHTFVADIPWWDDIGSIASYLQANRRWLSNQGKDSFVGEGATLAEGVTLTTSVIGAGARVLGQGDLRGCVVWPGATATAPLTDTVVTTQGQIAHV